METRSKARKERRASGIPLTPAASPQKQAPHRPKATKSTAKSRAKAKAKSKAGHPVSATPRSPFWCGHEREDSCDCGLDLRQVDDSGLGPRSRASEDFIATSLNITTTDLTNIVCAALAVKEALIATVGEHEFLQYKGASIWTVAMDPVGISDGEGRPMNDSVMTEADRPTEEGDEDEDEDEGGGVPVPWIARVGRHLEDVQTFTFESPNDLDLDPYERSEIQDDWKRLPAKIVNIHTGCVDMKTQLGRWWIAYSFVPAVIRVLQLSGTDGPGPALAHKLQSKSAVQGLIRANLLYMAVKLGLGTVSPAKQAVWQMAQGRRVMARVGMMWRGIREEKEIKEEKERRKVEERAEDQNYEVEQARDVKISDEIEQMVLDAVGDRCRVMTKELEQKFEIRSHKQTTHIMKMVEGKITDSHEANIATIDNRIAIESAKTTEKLETHAVLVNSRLAIQEAEASEALQAHVVGVDSRLETHQASITDTLRAHMASVTARFEAQDAKIEEVVELANFTNKSTMAQKETIAMTHEGIVLQSRELKDTRSFFFTRLDQALALPANPASEVIQAPVIATASAPDRPRLYLRMRNSSGTKIAGDAAIFKKFTKAYTCGESTFRVSHGLISKLTTPFLIALMGYSGTGKSHSMLSEEGVIAALLTHLPKPLNIGVYEVVEGKGKGKAILDFQYPQESVSQILTKINKARTTAPTVANPTSSRTHIAVHFENILEGVTYGCLVDIAGAEESKNRGELTGEMSSVSTEIALQNMNFRLLLNDLTQNGRAPFTGRENISLVKRVTDLNKHVVQFLKEVESDPSVRVLFCLDGSRMDMVEKALTVLPDFPV